MKFVLLCSIEIFLFVVTTFVCVGSEKWSDWTTVGPCSEPCGENSVKPIRRICIRENKDEDHDHHRECDEGDIEEDEWKCMLPPCPTNGGWSDWSENWSECGSNNCTTKKGIQYQYRVCNNPFPGFGGKMCSGPVVKARNCSEPTNCPVDGGWSSWSKWNCLKEDGYVARRTRKCTNPAPKFLGKECDVNLETESVYRSDDAILLYDNFLCKDFIALHPPMIEPSSTVAAPIEYIDYDDYEEKPKVAQAKKPKPPPAVILKPAPLVILKPAPLVILKPAPAVILKPAPAIKPKPAPAAKPKPAQDQNPEPNPTKKPNEDDPELYDDLDIYDDPLNNL